MRKLLFPIVLLMAALAMGGCDVREMGSLSSFSKPYAGVYECRVLRLGEEDVLAGKEVRLELKEDGAFTLSYRTAAGEGELGGTYTLDEARGELVLSKTTALRTAEHSFRYENGTISADFNFGGKLLHAEFSMP